MGYMNSSNTLANLFMWDLIRGFFGKIPILRSTIKWPHRFLVHRLSKVLILTNIATSTMYITITDFSQNISIYYILVEVKPRRSPISQEGLDKAFINFLLIGSYVDTMTHWCNIKPNLKFSLKKTCNLGNTQARQHGPGNSGRSPRYKWRFRTIIYCIWVYS